jgi:MYXO-CTERM domain-containing protein
MPDADSDSDGCGCRVASGSRRPNAPLAALLVLVVVGARVARRRRRLVHLASAALLWLAACGDDDTDIVANECGAACDAIAGECAVPTPSAGDCSAACTLAGGLAPACADSYAAVIACARARPLLACQDSTVSVTLSGDCLDPLADYLVCAAATITPICVDLPLQNADCVAQGLPRAAACVGTSPGCELQAGAVLDDQGVGVFCCPP